MKAQKPRRKFKRKIDKSVAPHTNSMTMTPILMGILPALLLTVVILYITLTNYTGIKSTQVDSLVQTLRSLPFSQVWENIGHESQSVINSVKHIHLPTVIIPTVHIPQLHMPIVTLPHISLPNIHISMPYWVFSKVSSPSLPSTHIKPMHFPNIGQIIMDMAIFIGGFFYSVTLTLIHLLSYLNPLPLIIWIGQGILTLLTTIFSFIATLISTIFSAIVYGITNILSFFIAVITGVVTFIVGLIQAIFAIIVSILQAIGRGIGFILHMLDPRPVISSVFSAIHKALSYEISFMYGIYLKIKPAIDFISSSLKTSMNDFFSGSYSIFSGTTDLLSHAPKTK